jgi:hypothetical protein
VQTSKSAESRVSKPAGRKAVQPTWKSATRQVWKPAPREPSRAELYHRSRGDITRTRKNPKTYHRFLGTIFWGAGKFAKDPEPQPLAGQKIPQNRKNTKKSVFFLERPPRFSAKLP